MNRPIAIVYALKEEIRPLLSEARIIKVIRSGAATISEAEFRGVSVIFCRTGVGLERASASVRRLLENYQPSVVLSLGYAGGCRPELKTGDLVLVRESREEANKVSPDARASGELEQLIREEGLAYESGTLVSVAAMAGVAAKHAWGDRGAAAVDMETVAVARAALEKSVPWIGLRVIFDAMEEELPWAGGTATDVNPLGALFRNPRSFLQVPRYYRMNRICQANLSKPVARWIVTQAASK